MNEPQAIATPQAEASLPRSGKTLLGLRPLHAATLAAYSLLVIAGVRHHEPWFDEAQSWLLARDLNWFDLMFHQVRYEGTPGLWVSLLKIATTLHLPYAALGITGAVCAIAGMYVFLRFAPFPEPVKVLLPFSYFAAYQYAVVARSYTLIPLFCFLAAHLYGTAEERTYRFTAVLALLAHVSAHGMAIAMGMAGAYAWQTLGEWGRFDAAARRRHWIALALFCVNLAAIAAIVWTPADSNSYALVQHPTLAEDLAILPGALTGSGVVSLAIFLLFAAWCFVRRRAAVFLLPVGMLVGLFIKVWVQGWHFGTLLFAMSAALWIAWPTPEERSALTPSRRLLYQVVTGTLIATLSWQLVWTAKTYAYDWSHPFSGSRDAAAYLKSVGADRMSLVAHGFSTTAVLPYFKTNIFLNEAQLGPGSYWHWSTADDRAQSESMFRSIMPDWVIIGWKSKEEGQASDRFVRFYGYSLVHESVGEMYFKNGVQQPDSYRIYRRNAEVPGLSSADGG